VAAPAYPVSCTPGDNLAVHVAVTTAPAGSVLVVDVGRVPDRGYWGEVLTTAAEAAGLSGLIIDGGVRDVAALHAHGFPVFSSTIALTGATKNQRGTVGSPVRVGGVTVALGDWVVGDIDGVTVIPGGSLDVIVTAGQEREAKEGGFFASLRSGKSTVELLHLDPTLITREGEGG
jgi:4-hydroxy-4-methyl-2-oxoglutarate aldolase